MQPSRRQNSQSAQSQRCGICLWKSVGGIDRRGIHPLTPPKAEPIKSYPALLRVGRRRCEPAAVRWIARRAMVTLSLSFRISSDAMSYFASRFESLISDPAACRGHELRR